MSELAAFLGVSAVVIATPGPDTALTIRNTLLGGRAAGSPADVAGVALVMMGIALHRPESAGSDLRRAERVRASPTVATTVTRRS
jgi:hypothetical protein